MSRENASLLCQALMQTLFFFIEARMSDIFLVFKPKALQMDERINLKCSDLINYFFFFYLMR